MWELDFEPIVPAPDLKPPKDIEPDSSKEIIEALSQDEPDSTFTSLSNQPPERLQPFFAMLEEYSTIRLYILNIFNPKGATFSEAILRPLLRSFPNLYSVVSTQDCFGKPKKFNRSKLWRFVTLVYLVMSEQRTLGRLEQLLKKLKPLKVKQIVRLLLISNRGEQDEMIEWRTTLLDIAESFWEQGNELSVEKLITRYLLDKFPQDFEEAELEKMLWKIAQYHGPIFFPIIQWLVSVDSLKHIKWLLYYLSLSEEEYHEKRYQKLDIPPELRSAWIQDYKQSVEIEWEPSLTFVFTDDPELLFRMWKAPMINSCIARDSDNTSKRSLAGVVATPWVKMATLLWPKWNIWGRMKVLLVKKEEKYFVVIDEYYWMRNLENPLRTIFAQILSRREKEGLIWWFSNIGDEISFLPWWCCSIVLSGIRFKGSEIFVVWEVNLEDRWT